MELGRHGGFGLGGWVVEVLMAVACGHCAGKVWRWTMYLEVWPGIGRLE